MDKKLAKLKLLADLIDKPAQTTLTQIERLDNDITTLKENDNKLGESISILDENKANKTDLEQVKTNLEYRISKVQTIKGDKGDKGEKGDKGSNGDKGDRGLDGKDGIDGRDGLDGKDGKDGLNAVVDYEKVTQETLIKIGDVKDSPEEIRNKLELLQGDERLDKSAIRGIKELEDKIDDIKPTIINHGGGGGNVPETDPLSIHLNQTTPQSFTGGDVTGTGLLKVTAGELGLDETEYQSQLSAGCVSMSEITDNGDGSISTDSHICNLYTNVNGTSAIKQYTIAGGTFTLTDMVNNYIVADYNSGTPIIRNTTTVDEINETTIIPLWTIFREGIHLHILDWDKLGLALANKLNQRLVKTERFSREYGLALSTSGRTVYTTAGKVWYGGAYQILDAVDSSTDDFFFYYPVSGVWTYDVITQFPNTYYSNGTDRLELGVAKYGSVFIYRGIETSAHIYCVVDGQHNTLASAQASQPPASLPPAITAHTILIGRIIFQKSATSATEVDSAFVTQFTSAGIVNHNDTSGIQGGTSGEYYHLTSTQYNAINKKTLQVSFKALYGTSPVWKLLDMETGTSIFPNGIQITSIYVKSSEADPTTELSADLKYCDAQGTGAFPSTNPTLIATIDTTTGNYSQTGMTTSIATNKVVYLSLDGASDDSVWTITINYTIL